ncbi:MAG: CHASE3 domain-containing protein, partial [Xanthomonadales bacterium]|nr:CHASE3 domain-containing protein [Xanthomonadales bacterium]
MADSRRRLQSTQRYYHALILLAGLVLLLSSALSIYTAANLRESIGWVTHSYEVTQQLTMLGQELGDAEAAQRANLLIEDAVSRERLQEAADAARVHLDALAAKIADNPAQSERVAALRSLIEARLAALISIADAKPGDVLEALRLPVDQGGATVGDGRLRALLQELTDSEDVLLRQRSAEMESLIAQTNSTVIIANALAIVAAGMGLFLIGRSRRAWQRALDAEGEKQQAQRASAEKSQFLASMSHEIRTPMNAIFGFTQLLSQREQDPQSRQYLRAIETSGDSLLSLINDILDLS